jgi:hypothetical protein
MACIGHFCTLNHLYYFPSYYVCHLKYPDHYRHTLSKQRPFNSLGSLVVGCSLGRRRQEVAAFPTIELHRFCPSWYFLPDDWQAPLFLQVPETLLRLLLRTTDGTFKL